MFIGPRPTNLVILSDSLRSGFRNAVWTVAGAALTHALLAEALQRRTTSHGSRRLMNVGAGAMAIGAGIWLATR